MSESWVRSRVVVTAAAFVCLAGASSRAQDAWDGPLFPVQQKKVVLPITCTREQPLRWEKEIAPLMKGLRIGDPVVALSADGAAEVTLGEALCFLGECGGNYASIEFDWPTGGGTEPFAVIKESLLGGARPSIPIAIPALDGPDCSEMFGRISNEDFPEIEKRRTCDIFRLGERTFLQLAGKWFMQENGWPVANVWGRVLTRSGETIRAHPPLQIDYDTNPLVPRLLLDGTDGPARLLWSKAAGICCPSALTLQMSRASPSGQLLLGRAFTAGGQPCD